MALLPKDTKRLDGLSLLYWMMMGPHGINRSVQKVEFSYCRKGLGVKIIGGYREQTGEEFGVYIKRVINGGLAAMDGRLKSGDLILDVNNNSLMGVTNERAVEILRKASLSNHMCLLIVRDQEAKTEFAELMEKYGSNNITASGRISPTQLSTGKLTDTASSSSSSRSESPQLLSPKDAGHNTAPFSDSIIQLICVSKATGLGLVIKGGANRAEGPMVFVQEITPGDCMKDGRLQVGDQLVSINKESLIGVTYEEARNILTHTKLRPDPTVEIAFIRRRSSSSSSSAPHSPVSLPQNRPPTLGINSPQHPPPLNPGFLPQTRAPSLGMNPPQHPPLLTKITSSRNPTSETLPAVNVTQVRLSSPRTDSTQSDSSNSTEPSSSQPERRCSIANTTRLKLDKLDQALDLLGIRPSDSQRVSLGSGLAADANGTVALTDFESVVKEVFKPQLDESRLSSDQIHCLCETTTNQTPSQSDSEDLDEMERLRKEHIEALREIKRLQEQLIESQRVHHLMEEELSKVRQDVKASAEESRALRSRIALAEAAQKQTRGMEMDYEEVIHLLEAEIAELKTHTAEKTGHTANKEETDELKKRVAVLECQLRKSEATKKSLELSTGKLLSFVENVQEFLLESHAPAKSYSSGDVKVGQSSQSLPPRYKKNPWTSATLAQEAKDLTRTVRAILEVDCLPYGWEEAYTADGDRYYINHTTQTTSWTLPGTSSSPSGSSSSNNSSISSLSTNSSTRVHPPPEKQPGSSIETEM